MHEMAVAQSVLDIAVGEMGRHASTGIRGIKLSIGEFSGVVKEALDFAFDVLKPGTPAAAANIVIEVVPMKADCPACGPVSCRLNDLSFFCPQCSEPVRLTAGREMKVDYVDLD
jgi:hydrogenase nickel incorporation protein HypA/HybF